MNFQLVHILIVLPLHCETLMAFSRPSILLYILNQFYIRRFASSKTCSKAPSSKIRLTCCSLLGVTFTGNGSSVLWWFKRFGLYGPAW